MDVCVVEWWLFLHNDLDRRTKRVPLRLAVRSKLILCYLSLSSGPVMLNTILKGGPSWRPDG